MKVIKIGAIWCPACIIMNNFWNEIKEDNNNLEFEELDIDMDEEEVKKYNIGDILPVIVLEENDTEIKRLVGEKSKEEIQMFLQGE